MRNAEIITYVMKWQIANKYGNPVKFPELL